MLWNDRSFGIRCKNVNEMERNQSFKVKFYVNFSYECGQGRTFCAITGENCCDNQQ